MACAKPLEAYRPAGGGPVKFNEPRDGRAYQKIELPCGQCILCRLEKARQWAVRISHEATLHQENCFLTLSYHDSHLPEHASLRYDDLQRFWKRLRKKIGPFRYYAVGEYGDSKHRPHYHACLFGHAFTEDRIILRSQPTLLWTNPVLKEAWGHGFVSVGALVFESAQYVAAYVTKKLNNKRQYVRVDEETGELIPLVQPRAFMSLKPAIGRTWLDAYGKAVYDHDHVVINGRPQKPPKYYDNWLKAKSEELYEKIKEERVKEIEKLSPEELSAKAEHALAMARLKKRA